MLISYFHMSCKFHILLIELSNFCPVEPHPKWVIIGVDCSVSECSHEWIWLKQACSEAKRVKIDFKDCPRHFNQSRRSHLVELIRAESFYNVTISFLLYNVTSMKDSLTSQVESRKLGVFSGSHASFVVNNVSAFSLLSLNLTQFRNISWILLSASFPKWYRTIWVIYLVIAQFDKLL